MINRRTLRRMADSEVWAIARDGMVALMLGEDPDRARIAECALAWDEQARRERIRNKLRRGDLPRGFDWTS